METVETKQSIEEIADEMLKWKVKGKRKLPCCPIKDAGLFSEGIQHLVDRGYLVKKEEDSKPIYNVTFEGFEHVYVG